MQLSLSAPSSPVPSEELEDNIYIISGIFLHGLCFFDLNNFSSKNMLYPKLGFDVISLSLVEEEFFFFFCNV